MMVMMIVWTEGLARRKEVSKLVASNPISLGCKIKFMSIGSSKIIAETQYHCFHSVASK